MSLFKTVRCRYFDDNGRPRKSYCPDGSRCRFIHPEDARWHQRRPRIKAEVDDSPRPARPASKARASPLASQEALFRLSANSDDIIRHARRDSVYDRDEGRPREFRDRIDFTDMHRGHNNSPNPLLGKRSRDCESKNMRRDPQDESRSTNDKQDSREAQNSSKGSNCGQADNSFSSPAGHFLGPDSIARHGREKADREAAEPEADKPIYTEEDKRTNALLREIASANAELSMATVGLRTTGQKLDSFKDLQSSLSGISSAASVSVAPLVRELEQEKRRLETDMVRAEAKVRILWQDAYGEIGKVVDGLVKEKTKMAKEETSRVILSELGQLVERIGERDQKRRKTAGPENESVSQEGRIQERRDIRDKLTGLELRVDRQDEMIGRLMRQNEELQTKLQNLTTGAHTQPTRTSPSPTTPTTSSRANGERPRVASYSLRDVAGNSRRSESAGHLGQPHGFTSGRQIQVYEQDGRSRRGRTEGLLLMR